MRSRTISLLVKSVCLARALSFRTVWSSNRASNLRVSCFFKQVSNQSKVAIGNHNVLPTADPQEGKRSPVIVVILITANMLVEVTYLLEFQDRLTGWLVQKLSPITRHDKWRV